MKHRHKIELTLTITDKVLEALGWIGILGVWLFTLLNYAELPEQIPTHYNLAGEADDFSSKWYIMLLPIVATILFISMTILNKYPHRFSYPAIITPHNAVLQYTNATRMIRFLKVSIVLIFGVIVYETLKYVNGDVNGLGTWSLPLILVLLIAPILYFIILGARRDSLKLKDTDL